MNAAARDLVATLDLRPLPREGGFFRQTGVTPAGSAILFLMTTEDFSALHRLPSDELWHFYAGDPVDHVQLDPRDGSARVLRLGPAITAGETPQIVAPAGVWQGARIVSGAHGWALLGCTMAPPWREEAFELGERAALQREFPAQAALIASMTR